jgi:hypothetical protein
LQRTHLFFTSFYHPSTPPSFSWKTFLNEQVFRSKWPTVAPTYWTTKEHQGNGQRGIGFILENPGLQPAVPRALTYPFFEAGVEDKPKKGYLHDFTGML